MRRFTFFSIQSDAMNSSATVYMCSVHTTHNFQCNIDNVMCTPIISAPSGGQYKVRSHTHTYKHRWHHFWCTRKNAQHKSEKRLKRNKRAHMTNSLSVGSSNNEFSLFRRHYARFARFFLSVCISLLRCACMCQLWLQFILIVLVHNENSHRQLYTYDVMTQSLVRMQITSTHWIEKQNE